MRLKSEKEMNKLNEDIQEPRRWHLGVFELVDFVESSVSRVPRPDTGTVTPVWVEGARGSKRGTCLGVGGVQCCSQMCGKVLPDDPPVLNPRCAESLPNLTEGPSFCSRVFVAIVIHSALLLGRRHG